jgi:hypothetical protein
MVQFIREQTRQYSADKSAAISRAQDAQTVGDVGQVVQNVGKLALSGIQQYRKGLEQADADIIATQYGKTAHNATIGELDKLATQYGVGTDKFKEEAYALAERNYAPQIEGMSTERYKTEMEARLRDTKDYIDTYKNSRRAQTIEGAKAQVAADSLLTDFGDEAYQQGARQEYSNIRGVDEYVKYASKKTGLDESDIKASVERDIAMSRMLGVIDNDIVSAASALEDKEVLQDYFTSVVERDPKYANLSDKKKREVIEKLTEDETRKEASNEHLREVLGSKYLDSLEKQYTKGLSEEKVRLQRELSLANPKSKKAEDLKAKLEEVKGKIDSIDEKDVLDIARQELKGGYGTNSGLNSMLKQRYAEFKQQMKVDAYNNAVSVWADALNPDPLVAQKAKWEIWASENGLIEKNSTKIGEWENKYNNLMTPIKDEVNVDDLAKDYQKFITNSETVKPQLHENYVGTMAMHDALQDLWNTPDLTPIQAVALGYKAINKMYEAPITEDQRQTFNNLVMRAIQDKGFGDLAKAVLENSDRYYPDTNWMENAFAKEGFVLTNTVGFVPSTLKETGMPEGGVRRTDVSKVKEFIDSKTQQAINDAMHQMVEVSYLPKEQQAPALQQISNELVAKKKNIFDDAMMNYGIDLNALDEQLDTKGKAYARIGFVLKEYKGRDDKGLPLFEDIEAEEQAVQADKILDLLLGRYNIGEE